LEIHPSDLDLRSGALGPALVAFERDGCQGCGGMAGRTFSLEECDSRPLVWVVVLPFHSLEHGQLWDPNFFCLATKGWGSAAVLGALDVSNGEWESFLVGWTGVCVVV